MMEDSRLYLRPIEDQDIDGIYHSVQDEETRYMTGTRRTFTKKEIIDRYRKFREDSSRRDFAICLREGDRVIGDLAIVDIDQDNRKAGFRISLHAGAYQNKGYGTEAVKLAVRYTFKELELNRLELEVYSHNIRGIKAYEKAGFQKEGVCRQSLFWNGRYSDEILMAVLKDEYVG
ncbi:GNAT family protein [Halobacillus sp. ACCC02827]|uniref:GNAT family N-acetyltransferase n=1 Tax=Halobacillus sp. ACCC02827 TaxID=3052090 RepID=UPI0025708B70|nr:GNAT family protein [Halobacillus sp. ACCC02827]WJE17189.1 GNAT family protein [Halobacillus sp. ACCC02827]